MPRPMDERERLQHRLEMKGIVRDHANVLSYAMRSNGVSADELDCGISIRFSGKLTSVFREGPDTQELLCQIERS